MKPESVPRNLRQAVGQAILLAVVMVSSLSLYLVVLKWRGPESRQLTQTDWDRHIPFRPEWVWVYLIPYLIGPALASLLSRDSFWWFIRRGLGVVFVSLLIFAVYPTQTVRPPVDGLETGPTADLYRDMVAIDEPPANAAPSLHVSLTCLLALAVVRDYRRWWPVALFGAGVVWLATLLTHQHHVIDVGTGIGLAFLAALPLPRGVARKCAGGRNSSVAAPDERRGVSPPW